MPSQGAGQCLGFRVPEERLREGGHLGDAFVGGDPDLREALPPPRSGDILDPDPGQSSRRLFPSSSSCFFRLLVPDVGHGVGVGPERPLVVPGSAGLLFGVRSPGLCEY